MEDYGFKFPQALKFFEFPLGHHIIVTISLISKFRMTVFFSKGDAELHAQVYTHVPRSKIIVIIHSDNFAFLALFRIIMFLLNFELKNKGIRNINVNEKNKEYSKFTGLSGSFHKITNNLIFDCRQRQNCYENC